ncbi:MAG: cysteine--tRNA ligase [Desulfuromonadales bacterium]|nr:cysteine--tRNA ligase [Desulfuromonadales bacterium]
MPLKIYNTFTGMKEEFVPITPGKAKMYVCGVTVYDDCHIGHARANVAFDVVYRYLLYSGYEVEYVRNYTDIDDKIINRANREGVAFNVISERYIKSFDEDMARLNTEIPTYQPKATEHISEIIKLVETLIERGAAYHEGNDVYFSVENFKNYLQLSKRNLEEMRAGARIEVDERKRNPMDFTLWKGAKPGEPSWDSPWGKGRPGWHIECSAMGMKILGETFDIHGGGKDLIFPHHENEIAQSEAATGKQFVRYWMHNGFVNINSEKMSKSLGNFFTVRDVLKRYDSEVLRFFLLSAHYRSPIDFSDQNLADAGAGLERIYKALALADEIIEKNSSTAPVDINHNSLTKNEAELYEKIINLENRFKEAMDDDFNAALAIAHIFDLIRSLNKLLVEKPTENTLPLLSNLKESLARLAKVLGVINSVPIDYLKRIQLRKTTELSISAEEIEQLVAERAAARKERNFKRSDEIRDFLAEKGIEIFDSPKGSSWRVK